MFQKLKNNQGFTIIEVLIVLAIAGLIMLVVFLAVPALQRNSRNTQRNSDAALISAAVGECMANRNGQTASCDTLAEIPLDTARLSQLTTVAYANGFPAAGNSTTANWFFGLRCAADGATTQGGTARAFVVQYNTETAASTAPRCIES